MSIEMCLLLACTHPTWSGFARILPLLQSLFLFLLEVMRLLLWQLENQRFLNWAIGLLVSFWLMNDVGNWSRSTSPEDQSLSRFDSRKDMSILPLTNSELPSAVNLYKSIFIHRDRSFRHQFKGCRLERLDFCAVRNALKIEPKNSRLHNQFRYICLTQHQSETVLFTIEKEEKKLNSGSYQKL